MSDPIIKNFTWPDRSKLSRGAFEVVRKLRGAGHEALLAGGAVRDAVLKKPIQEIDIATSARPKEVEGLFPKTIPTGEKHGTITVRTNSVSYEITTFRREGAYIDARRPSRVTYVKKAELDAGRRDFTINALFYNPDSKQIIDFIGGLQDIEKKKIRTVGRPEDRFAEDALRLLRAVRFAVVLDFIIEPATRRAVKKFAKNIKKISAERVKQELDKIMLSENPTAGFELLNEVNLLREILPEVKKLQGVKQPRNLHSEGDVWKHTMLALTKFGSDYDLETRYAVLFHDLGKARTAKRRTVRGKRRITFYEHQKLGAQLAETICKRLKFSAKSTEKITWLIKNHHVPMDFEGMKLSTRRKWALEPYFNDLLELFLTDASASIPVGGKKEKIPKEYRIGKRISQDIESKPKLKKPLLSGHEVMKILKLKEGPSVGKILRELEEKKLQGEIETKGDAKKYLLKITL